jgi:8-amino-7-oxononanoate synthase
MATLSKACGLCGAFIAADGDFIDYLVNTSKEYIYSTSAPAYIAHGLLTSLKIINGEEGNALRKHLNELTDYFRKEARNLPGNVILLPSSTSIQPLIIGDNKRLMEISVFLKSKGILCGAIRPPTVPAGTARLRIPITAAHDRNDITRLLQTLNDAFNSIT